MKASVTAVSTLHDRLLSAVGDRSCGQIARITRTHPETTRRYLRGQSPSVEFVIAFSEALNVNPTWLLTGRGAMHGGDLPVSEPVSLLNHIERTIEALSAFKHEALACTCAKRPSFTREGRPAAMATIASA